MKHCSIDTRNVNLTFPMILGSVRMRCCQRIDFGSWVAHPTIAHLAVEHAGRIASDGFSCKKSIYRVFFISVKPLLQIIHRPKVYSIRMPPNCSSTLRYHQLGANMAIILRIIAQNNTNIERPKTKNLPVPVLHIFTASPEGIKLKEH